VVGQKNHRFIFVRQKNPSYRLSYEKKTAPALHLESNQESDEFLSNSTATYSKSTSSRFPFDFLPSIDENPFIYRSSPWLQKNQIDAFVHHKNNPLPPAIPLSSWIALTWRGAHASRAAKEAGSATSPTLPEPSRVAAVDDGDSPPTPTLIQVQFPLFPRRSRRRYPIRLERSSPFGTVVPSGLLALSMTLLHAPCS
jgi:hypothetical protein